MSQKQSPDFLSRKVARFDLTKLGYDMEPHHWHQKHRTTYDRMGQAAADGCDKDGLIAACIGTNQQELINAHYQSAPGYWDELMEVLYGEDP